MVDLKNILGTHRESVLNGLKHITLNDIEGKVLDVGCGTCEFKPYFDEFKWKWYGLDKEPKVAGVIFAEADKLPFTSEKFNLVFASHVFEHCERPVDVLREFKRVLKPGATLFLAIPIHSEKMISVGDEDHIFVLTDIQMRKLLEYTGYKDTQVWEEKVKDDIIFNSLIIVARKP